MKYKALLSVITLIPANLAFAQNTLWQGFVDSDFTNDGNWNNGAPTSSHVATVRAGGSATLSGIGQAGQMRVGQITGTSGAITTVNFETGSAYTSKLTEIGYSLASDSAASNGALNVNGGTHAISQLYIGSKKQGTNANDVTGNLVINGGTLSVRDSLYIAFDANAGTGSSSGTVTVNGGILNYTSSVGQFYIGHSGKGTLHVNGGTVNLANGLRLSHTVNGSSTLRLSSGRLNLTGGFFDWGSGRANMTFEISKGAMVLNGNRIDKLEQYFGTDGTNGLASVIVTGGLMNDRAFSRVYTKQLRKLSINGYILKYGYDGSGNTAVWAVATKKTR